MRVALVALALVALAAAEAEKGAASTEKPLLPPGTRSTRTSLHVARSLDPDSVETLSVRTRTGEMASIVVKRRGPKTAPAALPAPVAVASAPVSFVREPPTQDAPAEDKENATKTLERGPKLLSSSAPPSPSLLPPPVSVRSDAVWVKGAGPPSKKGRGLISVGRDGVPVVTGVRVPDDEADRTRTWRNARVINNVLVTQRDDGKVDDAARGGGDDAEARRPPAFEEDSATRDRLLQYIQAVNSREWSASLPVEARSEDSGEGIRGARYLSHSASRDSPSGELQARLLVPASAFHHQLQQHQAQRPLLVRPRPPASRVSFEEGVRTPVLQYAHPELGVQPAKVARSRLDREDEPTPQTEAAPVTPSAVTAASAPVADRRTKLPAHVPPPSALIQKQLAAVSNVDRDEVIRRQEAALAHFARDAHSDRSPFAVEPALDPQDNGDAADAALVLEEQELSGSASSQGGNSYERRGRDGPGPSQQQLLVSSSSWNRRPQPASSYLPEDSYGLSSDKYIRKYPSYGKDSYTRYAGVSSSASDSSGSSGGSSYNPYTSGSGESGYGKYGLSNNRFANQYGSPETPYGAASLSSYNAQYSQYDAPQPPSSWAGGPTSAAFWTRLGEEIRTRVNSGMARVGDLTRPVVQPLLDATQRLGHNLGLTASAPQRLVLHYDPRHPPPPPPHHLHHMHHPHHHPVQQHGPYGFQEKARSLDADTILLVEQSEEVTPERPSGDERNEEQQLRRRRRRDADRGDNALDAPVAGTGAGAVPGGAAAWAHTPCAKRIFCDAMLQRSHDDVVLTEKKMAAAYALVARGDPSVAFHLGDVMAAVRKGDCSAFSCPSGLASKFAAQPVASSPLASPRR